MNCVNVNLPAFKEAKERLNLSEDTLKQTVQAYWEETKNDKSFPDDQYITKFLGIDQTYDEKSDNQAIYDVYEQQFSEPKTFTDEDKYNNYVKAAKQVFPENAVITHTDSNNKKVVIIKRPFNKESYEKEIKNILDNAPRDAEGRLLAPNGKPSNLNERQYAQVRTKAFKKWFGDWELPTIFTANNVDNVKALQEKYPSQLPNKFYHHSTNSFGKQRFDSREGKKEKLHIIGRLTTNKVDVLVVENPNSNNAIAHITLATAEGVKPVESNAELQKHKDEIVPVDDYADTTFTNNLDNNVSKVVDENGEPLVVYHTSKNIYHNRSIRYTLDMLFDQLKEEVRNHGTSSVSAFNKKYGTNFGKTNEGLLTMGRHPKFKGVSASNSKDTKIVIKNAITREALMSYVKKKFSLDVKFLSDAEYREKASDNNRSNCCIKGDTVYLRKSRELSNEQILEEFLHPTVFNYLATHEKEGNALFEKAQKEFPDLWKQIQVLYTNTNNTDSEKLTQKNELVTQVLAKYVHKEISENKARSLVSEILKFFKYIADQFKDLFGNVDLDALKEGKFGITGDKLNDIFTYENFASVFNVEQVFFKDTLSQNGLFDNLTPDKLPDSSQTINIYAGTGENADLSNFAERPFIHKNSDGSYKKFQSVEQAFQYTKAANFSDTRANAFGTGKGMALEAEIMETTNGAELRKLGRAVKELNVPAWDRASSSVMKEFIKESFEQNPQALQRLLATGNATLTHTQDKGKWGTKFPKLLMEVRDELRNNNQTAQQQSKTSVDVNNISNNTASYGVIIDTRLKSYTDENTKTIARQWLKDNPKGIVAFRLAENYNTPEMVNAGAIGNPFNWKNPNYADGKALRYFYDWLVTGNNFNEPLATKEYRQAIINKIVSTPENSPILYYKELGRPSHATVLGYLIANKYLLSSNTNTNNNYLNITPAKSADTKAAVKGSISNKFIGFAEGILGSSTADYAVQAGDKANTGDYNSDDTIFVSIPGKRGDAILRRQQQDRTIDEAIKALEAGATIITDNKAYTEASDYNEGEKRLAEKLTKLGYEYSDRNVNDTVVGQWKKPESTDSESYFKGVNITLNSFSNANAEKMLKASDDELTAIAEKILADGRNKGIKAEPFIKGILETRERLRKFGKPTDDIKTTWNLYKKALSYNMTKEDLLWIQSKVDEYRLAEENNEPADSVLPYSYYKQYKYALDRMSDYMDGYEYSASHKGYLMSKASLELIKALAEKYGKSTDDGVLDIINDIWAGQFDLSNIDDVENLKRISEGEDPVVTDSDKLSSKSLFILTPLKESESQAGEISKFVNGYIGATQAAQLGESSVFTGQAGPAYANTGNYNSESIIYVNMPDAFSSEDIAECQAILERAIDALEKGATIVTDANPGYNEANPSNMLWRMYNTLEQKGYVFERVEAKKDDTSIVLNTWRKKANIVPSTEINKVPESDSHSKSVIDVFKAKNEHPDLYKAEYVENGTLGKALGRTKDGKIYLNKSITVKDVLNHLYGHEKGDNSTEQKALVAEGLKDVLIDEDTLSELLSKNEQIPYWFVYYHELSHVLNNDEAVYYKNGKDLTTSDKLAIEARATIDAWNAVIDKYNITDLFRIQPVDTSNFGFNGERKELHKAKRHLREKFKSQRNRYRHLSSLLENPNVTHSEIKELANGVAFNLSDLINDIMNDPNLKDDFNMSKEEKENYYKTLKVNQLFANSSGFTPFNPKGMDRITLINRLGISRIMWDNIFPNIFSNAGKTFLEMKKIKTIKEHADGLLYLASNALAANEGIHLSVGKDKSITVQDGVKIEDPLNGARDNEDVQENEGSLQEKWQIDSRTEDVLTSMTKKVRNEIYGIYKTDKDGNRIKGVFGIEQRVDIGELTNQLLNWCQGCLTVNDVVKRLEDKRKNNPWVKEIIDKLENKTGEYTEFRSQFYSTFTRHFQNYSITTKDEDKQFGYSAYKNKTVNSSSLVNNAMSEIVINIKIGIHPLFTSDNKISTESLKGLKTNIDYLEKVTIPKIEHGQQLEKTDAQAVAYAINFLGYNITPDDVFSVLNYNNVSSSVKALNNIFYTIQRNRNTVKDWNPFVYRKENGKRVDIRGNFQELLKPFLQNLQEIMPNSVYDDGKLYQAFTVPSYVSKLITSVHNMSKEEFNEYMFDEFGQYDFFRYAEDANLDGYRSEWLRRLATEPNARKVLDHDVELNFDDSRYMRGMDPSKYILSLATHFFKEGAGKGEENAVAWYRIPIMSNKPSSEFIRFYAHTGSDYQNVISDGFVELALQELTRIQTVRMQLESWSVDSNGNKKDPSKDSRYIKSYHKNGQKFCFLDFLNDYLNGSKKNSELGKLINRKLKSGSLGADENNLKIELVKAIQENVNAKVDDIIKSYERRGLLAELRLVDGISDADNTVEENIRKWLWNDMYGTSQILEMFVTDIAYFKDVDDLQKRLAQIHAPGLRGDITVVDFDGNPVLSSDGKMRTILLTDFDGFVSNIKQNVSIVFDRKAEQSKSEVEAEYYRNLKNKLCGYTDEKGEYHEGEYDKINVTDAQGYSSPTGYRKKAFMFGKWTRENEAVYKALREGTYKISDIEQAFPILKPFVYTNLTKPVYVENAPMSKQKVPFSIKNSEYLLIMTDAILRNEDTGIPNMLRALYEVMEESAYDSNGNYTGKGIDTVNFESTCKTGLSGRINVNTPILWNANPKFKEFVDTIVDGIPTKRMFGEVKAKELLKKCLYNPETMEYNPNFVHEFSANDYSIQQEVPEHFMDHTQQWGSQMRMITPADLELIDAETGAENEFEYEDYVNGEWVKVKKNATDIRLEFEKEAAKNINLSIAELIEEFGLGKNYTNAERNIILADLLQNEILENPRYGFDLYLACNLDENGQFRMPLGDPILATRIEQLVTSMVKNRINKQKIHGGPVVQVSNFGTSDRLSIVYNDKNGNKLMTFSEFKQSWKSKSSGNYAKEFNSMVANLMMKNKLGRKEAEIEAKKALGENSQSSTVEEAFKEYLKNNQGGIAYFEVYAPLPSQEIFDTYMNPDGTIDIESIEQSCPELLQMIGYRIPTEDKYSIAPLKIKGFLPRTAGEGIMLPFEITLLTGSDFDVDKEYVMRKDIKLVKTPTKEAADELIDEYLKLKKLNKESLSKYQINQYKSDLITLLKNPSMFATDKADLSIIKKYRREYIKPEKVTSGRTYTNNKMFDMAWSIYTHKSNADKILNPGEFDEQKLMAFRTNAYKTTTLPTEYIDSMNLDQLKDLANSSRNLLNVDTQIDFYEKNNAASAGLGMAAVQKIAHATLGGDGNYIDVSELLDGVEFTFCGVPVRGEITIDPIKDRQGKLIGKTLGSHVAAFADAAKEPCMSLLNIDSNTFNTASTMLRLGWTFEDVALFMSQTVITDVLNELSKEKISNNNTNLNRVISDKLKKAAKEAGIEDYNSILTGSDINHDFLVKKLRNREIDTVGDITILAAYQAFSKFASALKGPSFVTRFNSINTATGPTVIDDLISEYKEDYDTKGLYDANGESLSALRIKLKHPVLYSFRQGLDCTRTILQGMPNYSGAFNAVVETMPKKLKDIIYRDRKALKKFSDFFLSYMLVDNDIVSNKRLKYLIDQFPNDFIKNYKYQEKYAKNKLIQNIVGKASDTTNETTLTIPTTGITPEMKDELSAAWYDLYRMDSKLALALFEYNFFKGGLGYNPKTFMHLLPLQIRESINGYKELYSNIVLHSNPLDVLKNFLAHNTDDESIFPTKKDVLSTRDGDYTKISYTKSNGNNKLTFTDVSAKTSGKKFSSEKFKTFKNVTSFKFFDADNNVHYMFRNENLSSDTVITFDEIIPLGNNKSFLVMYKSSDNIAALKPESKVINNSNEHDNSELIIRDSEGNILNDDGPVEVTETETQEYKKALAAIEKENLHKKLGKKSAKEYLSSLNIPKLLSLKDTPIIITDINNVLQKYNISVNLEQLDKLNKTFCK